MKQKGERTLLASVILSSPGPLVLGIALFSADLVRRLQTSSAALQNWRQSLFH